MGPRTNVRGPSLCGWLRNSTDTLLRSIFARRILIHGALGAVLKGGQLSVKNNIKRART